MGHGRSGEETEQHAEKKVLQGIHCLLMSYHYREGRLATEDDELAEISSNPYNVPNIRGLI